MRVKKGGDGKSRSSWRGEERERASAIHVRRRHGASDATNSGSTVASGRSRGRIYVTAPGGTPGRGGARQRYKRLQGLNWQTEPHA